MKAAQYASVSLPAPSVRPSTASRTSPTSREPRMPADQIEAATRIRRFIARVCAPGLGVSTAGAPPSDTATARASPSKTAAVHAHGRRDARTALALATRACFWCLSAAMEPHAAEPAPSHAVARHRGLVGRTLLVSGLTLLSRLLGFAREALMAGVFGDRSVISDAFITAWRVPNLFRRLLGEGALSVSLQAAMTKADIE